MTVNTELLEQVMQHIEDHPEQHDQTSWMDGCGTSACFAGWACLLNGWTLGRWRWDEPTVVSPDKRLEMTVYRAARELLGIGEDTADNLFYAANSRPMLRLMVKDLVNGAAIRDTDKYRDEVSA